MEHSLSAIIHSEVRSSEDSLAADSRYDEKKRSGSSYTPTALANFVAKQIVKNLPHPKTAEIRVLDPAVGDGELLLSIANELTDAGYKNFSISGFDTNVNALEVATRRIDKEHSNTPVHFEGHDFLVHVLDSYASNGNQSELFDVDIGEKFDLVIANPPYVRTQVLGAERAQKLTAMFGLSGRTDLYHAFILAISTVLREGGELGIIVSNRFMTTKSGLSVRECFLDNFQLHHVYDLGDTKLFDEAVLPAVIVGQRNKEPDNKDTAFTRSYEKVAVGSEHEYESVLIPLDANFDGIVSVGATSYEITQGILHSGESHSDVWRVSTAESVRWLETVEKYQKFTFRDIGKIRVGVKTTADKVFIRRDWDELGADRPEDEVLLPLLTHKEAHRWIAKLKNPASILYTHQVLEGKRRPIDLDNFPYALKYLESKRDILEGRSYVTKAGRKWYEIWVPQDPSLWSKPKLVFRDIAEHSTFFLDHDGSVINGDCYWMVAENVVHPDILWLAMAIGNSSFVLKYYDERFHNKLYSNRRRFMTQYVEQFPIPDPRGAIGTELIGLAKKAYDLSKTSSAGVQGIEDEIDRFVWKAFGLVKE